MYPEESQWKEKEVDIDFIQRRRVAKGITFDHLAKAFGVSKAAIWQKFVGLIIFSADEISLLAQILECDLDDLYREAKLPLSLRERGGRYERRKKKWREGREKRVEGREDKGDLEAED